MLDRLLEEMENDEDAMLMYPASSQAIARVQKKLQDMKLPILPGDYLYFLHQTNGLIFGDVMLYGTDEVEEERLPDLIEANRTFKRGTDQSGVLVIGQDSGDIFIYDSLKDAYEILDKSSGETVEEFESLTDLIMEFYDDDLDFYDDEEDGFGLEEDDEG